MKITNPTALLGENLACEYLQKKGFKIVERNFRQRYGEIDIIAVGKTKGYGIHEGKFIETLIFVEVKTRKSLKYGTPLEAIGKGKLRELLRTAQFYKLSHKQSPDLMRIDAISVTLKFTNELDTIEHVENISS